MLKYILLAVVMGVMAFAAVVRVRPIAESQWHVLPSSVATKGAAGRFTVTKDGDIAPYVVQGSLQDVAKTLRARIEQTPRTELLAGALEDGFATYVTRSKLWGFPDITNVMLTDTGSGTQVQMAARLVYGKADLGVNEARVRDWLAAIKG